MSRLSLVNISHRLNSSEFSSFSLQGCTSQNPNDSSKTNLKNIAIPIVAILGLLGNFAAIFSITYSKVKSAFHQSLIAICTCDILFISIVLIDKNVNISADLPIIYYPIIYIPIINPNIFGSIHDDEHINWEIPGSLQTNPL